MNTQTASAIKQSKFLVCVDDSDEARAALRFACLKAKKRDILIELLHVINPMDMHGLHMIETKMQEDRKCDAAELLEGMAKDVYSILEYMPELHVREGDPADEIIAQTMEDYDANMIVLGVKPQGAERGKLISRIVKHAGDKLLIPVMLIPAHLTDEQMEAIS